MKRVKNAIADLTTKLDYSAGLLFYDVQFTLNGEAQEAYVDAVTGEILYSGDGRRKLLRCRYD